MKKAPLWGVFILSVCLVVLPSLLLAQNTGKIAGEVTDAETGQPLIGANVMVEGTNLGAATDMDGTFIILQVPPGTYNVSVVYIGYQKVTIQNVEVSTDLTTRMNFELKPQAVAGEEVTVVAEREVIRKDLTSAEARVRSEDIERMPVQELGDLLDLQAGITRDAGGGIHIRGGRSTEVSYTINGISITDNFSRTQALQVENQSIQELQVISGTFNAEYGNAMSGIINVVTKTGGNNFKGGFEVWSSDYVSTHDEIFWNIDDVNFTDNYNFQGSLSGPIIRDELNFFVSGRRWYNDGWIYGPKAFTPQGNRGDSTAVAMNYQERWSGQGTLEWKISTPFKLRIDALGSISERRNYDHFFRLNPTGDRGDNEAGFSVIPKITHNLGKLTFHEITFAYKYNQLRSRLYEDPQDPRYVHPDSLNAGAFQFVKAGTDLSRFKRYTKSQIVKWDLTSQVTDRHQVKLGIDLNFDKVFYGDTSLVPKEDTTGQQIEPFIPDVRPPSTPVHTRFTREPFKFAAYIQDKIEYESLIINMGLRFDLFDPNGKVPADPEDPNIYNPFKLEHIYKDTNGDGEIGLNEQTEGNKFTLAEREKFWWKDTEVKTLLSPRLGVAYPITETGVIHFSYGIFQQVPDYSLLYVGDQLKVTESSGTHGPFGNPDLNPQQTTMYELGLQQQLTQNLAIDVTGFYRDIRDWVSTSQPIPTVLGGVSYVRYVNRDFANVRGITLSVNRQFANNFSFNVDYTFQIAEGTNSNPDQEFFAQLGGAEPTRTLTPLNWDQRHALNANVFVGTQDWGVSLIGRYNSGQPYTPQIVTGTRVGRNILSGLQENSRVKPDRFTVDLRAHQNLRIAGLDFQVFARIFNLLDARNPVNVFGDTGEADFTLQEIQAAQTEADPTWFDHPEFYAEPRRIQIGTKISFR